MMIPNNTSCKLKIHTLKQGALKFAKTAFTSLFSTAGAMATHYNTSDNAQKTYQFGTQVISTLMVMSFVKEILPPLFEDTARDSKYKTALWKALQITLITLSANALMYAERSSISPVFSRKGNLETTAIFTAYLGIDLLLKLIVEKRSPPETRPHLMAGVDMLVTVSGAVLAGTVQYFSSPFSETMQANVRAAVSFGHATLFQAAGEHILASLPRPSFLKRQSPATEAHETDPLLSWV